MPRVRGRRRGRADPSRPRRHDVRIQARRRREIRKDHGLGRRSLPGDAGRVGAHRSHSREVDRRHSDSESYARADLAARAAPIGDVPALDVEADDRARENDPRRAVHDRSHGDASPAHCRIDGHRKVGRDQRDAFEHSVPRITGRSAPRDDRSQARRAWDVRGHPAPDDAGRG